MKHEKQVSFKIYWFEIDIDRDRVCNRDLVHQVNIPLLLDQPLYLVNPSLYPIHQYLIVIRLRPIAQNSKYKNGKNISDIQIHVTAAEWFTFVSKREISCFSSATVWLCSVNLILTFISSSFMRDSKSEYLWNREDNENKFKFFIMVSGPT